MKLTLPAILDIPPKLLPIITEFNTSRRMLLTGGRGGGKTQAVARLLLWVASKRHVRIVCGRELQSSITESVYTVFCDLIEQYSLGFKIQANKIISEETNSVISFKGFRDQGRTNIKGLEGVDILWVDEAEAITKETLDVINPTIRKAGSMLIFTMNRRNRYDPVYLDAVDRDDCLRIVINYNENKYCPKELINEAMDCKERSESDYNHIWLGQPLSHGDMMVFDVKDLDACNDVSFYGSTATLGKVLAIDIANGGGDLSVAGLLEYKSPTRFNLASVTTWDSSSLMETTGRIQALKHEFRPDLIVVDATGVGEGAYDRLCELGVNVYDFKGTRRSTSREAYNQRADAYLKTRDLIAQGQIKIEDKRVIDDLEVISWKMKSDGKKIITSKAEIKKEIQRSPDFADMLSMAVWGLDKLTLGEDNQMVSSYEII